MGPQPLPAGLHAWRLNTHTAAQHAQTLATDHHGAPSSLQMSLLRGFFWLTPCIGICTNFPPTTAHRIADAPVPAYPGEARFRVHQLWD